MSSVSEKIVAALAPFKPLFTAFRKAGFQLYAVGGCVRDWVLGRDPKDIDFTTDAVPEEIKRILADHGYKVIPIGEVFGTIATVIDRKNYEITTFRVKESYTRGSRHPIVCYGRELALDLERRDLTINAMAANECGEIVDPFDGLGDLERHLLRVPHSSYTRTIEIFGDDPLRILRLARFKARLDFDVSPEATQAACHMAGSVLTVSHERWFAELDGLLNSANPAAGLAWLQEIGVWQMLMPETVMMPDVYVETADLSGLPVNDSDHSLWQQTLARIQRAPVSHDMRWAALLSMTGYVTSRTGTWADQVSLMMASDILLRLKLSNARIQSILSLLTPVPDGMPGARSTRELAIQLGTEIQAWVAFQRVRLETVTDANRTIETRRLDSWEQALRPYADHPETAEVRMPSGLSKNLSEKLGVRGKTLGLCLAHCREAVLDGYLSEADTCDVFVDWVRTHFDAE